MRLEAALPAASRLPVRTPRVPRVYSAAQAHADLPMRRSHVPPTAGCAGISRGPCRRPGPWVSGRHAGPLYPPLFASHSNSACSLPAPRVGATMRDLTQVKCGQSCAACKTGPSCASGKPKNNCCWTPSTDLTKPKEGVCTVRVHSVCFKCPCANCMWEGVVRG